MSTETESLIQESETDQSAYISQEEAISRSGFGRFHLLMAIIMGWANSADTIEILSVSFILPYASCELSATDIQLGFLTAVGFAGMLIGSLVWGTLADVIGRLKALLICQTVNAVFSVLSSISQSFWFLVGMRFLSGIGVGGTNPLIFVYAVELLPAEHRGRYTSILSICYMIGQIFVAGLAWFILPHANWNWSTKSFHYNHWRFFLGLASIPVITSVLLFKMFPESPRFLMQMGRMSEAKESLKRIYVLNGRRGTYDENYKIAVSNIDCRMRSRRPLWLHLSQVKMNLKLLVTNREILKRFLISSIILFSLAFSYYGLTMWFPTLLSRMENSNATSVCSKSSTYNSSWVDPCDFSNQSQVYFETFLQALSTLPGNILYCLIIDKVGRKILLGLSMILTGISVFAITLVKSHTESIVVSCVYSGITVFSWNALTLMTSELFPTALRSTARGIQAAFFNRLASVFASLTFGAFAASSCTTPLILIAGLSVCGALLTYKLPDTRKIDLNKI